MAKSSERRRSNMSSIDSIIRSQAITRYVNRGATLALRCGLMFFCAVSIASAQTGLKQSPSSATTQVLHAQQFGFPVDVLVQGPADAETELQIICLFHSDPSNTLHGSLIEMNKKLQGLLDVIRTPSLFAG